jgi:hypothetical protein
MSDMIIRVSNPATMKLDCPGIAEFCNRVKSLCKSLSEKKTLLQSYHASLRLSDLIRFIRDDDEDFTQLQLDEATALFPRFKSVVSVLAAFDDVLAEFATKYSSIFESTTTPKASDSRATSAEIDNIP